MENGSNCPVCGEPKVEIRNNSKMILRCSCDWLRGYAARLTQTVKENCLNKNIKDWSPRIFKNGGGGLFKNLIKIQKALAIKKLYDFCFKVSDAAQGLKRHALYRSMERHRNLYLRGPKGSGRDLLVSTIKMFAAAKDITATPIPADWSNFKIDVSQADWTGREAEAAKERIIEQYRSPSLLTLADVRGEQNNKRLRYSTMIDEILAKRALQTGSMIFTSFYFIRELGDGMGDKLPELLNSDDTTLLYFFSCDEADALLKALSSRLHNLRSKVIETNIALSQSKKKLEDQLGQDKFLEQVDEVFLLETAFPDIAGNKGKNESLTLLMGIDFNKYHQSIQRRYVQFNQNKTQNNLAYQEGIKKAFISIVKDCPELAGKMEEREMLETGRMMSIACSGKEVVMKHIADAKKMIEKINND